MMLFTFKQFFLRYDIPLVVLVEVVNDTLANKEKCEKLEQQEKPIVAWVKSKTARNKYRDIIDNECIA